MSYQPTTILTDIVVDNLETVSKSMRIISRPFLLWISTASTATSFQAFQTGFRNSDKIPSLAATASGLAVRFSWLPSSNPLRYSSSLRMSSTGTATEKTLRVALCQFHVTVRACKADFLVPRLARNGAEVLTRFRPDW